MYAWVRECWVYNLGGGIGDALASLGELNMLKSTDRVLLLLSIESVARGVTHLLLDTRCNTNKTSRQREQQLGETET